MPGTAGAGRVPAVTHRPQGAFEPRPLHAALSSPPHPDSLTRCEMPPRVAAAVQLGLSGHAPTPRRSTSRLLSAGAAPFANPQARRPCRLIASRLAEDPSEHFPNGVQPRANIMTQPTPARGIYDGTRSAGCRPGPRAKCSIPLSGRCGRSMANSAMGSSSLGIRAPARVARATTSATYTGGFRASRSAAAAPPRWSRLGTGPRRRHSTLRAVGSRFRFQPHVGIRGPRNIVEPRYGS